MANLLVTHEIADHRDFEGIYCIPAESGLISLCGHCDVSYIEHDAKECPPNCKRCLSVLDYCKKLRLPKAG